MRVGTVPVCFDGMAHILFFEKPGCSGNARQRSALEAAGHSLTRLNLLDTPWTREDLLKFLGNLPVNEWFNRSAPKIKRGELAPESLDAETALAALLAEPLLIRRPLMQREDGARLVGFDAAAVERFVGLGAGPRDPVSIAGCVKSRNPDESDRPGHG